jgi:hypothetical protein
MKRGRLQLGLPADWNVVESWLMSHESPPYPKERGSSQAEKKWPSIQKLDNYDKPAPDSFWNSFPFNPVPRGVTKRVNEVELSKLLNSVKGQLTSNQFKRGEVLIKDLSVGANAYQKRQLPPIRVPNADSAFEHGEMLTDKLATWVDSGIVCGPFRNPPFPGFRSNALMAVEKNGAIRPIIHMSKPEGFSFNDNLEEKKIEKVHMNVARDFGYLLKETGRDAVMSKYDLKDAFKLIPARPSDWKLQGFSWAGRFFFETNMIFGASPSVSNFDRLGSTLVEIAVAKSKIPRKFVLRTLDDIPIVSPPAKKYTAQFGLALRGTCQKINVKLAENCPENVKAFEHVTKGVVLGVCFDSTKLEWSLKSEKADRFMRRIVDTMHMDFIDLKQLQGVMGVVNDIVLMCSFMKPFRNSGNKLLQELGVDQDRAVRVSSMFKADLKKFANLLEAARSGVPLSDRPALPPLFSKMFYSDASGSSFALARGERVSLNAKEDRGVACIEVAGDEVVWWCELTWPDYLLNCAVDEKGAYFGSKTTTLESIGVLLPFLTVPSELCGKHLVFTVDNIAVVYGWDNRGVKFDDSASVILLAVHLISSYLGCTVHITHSPRRSTVWEELVDNLSRKSSRSADDWRKVKHAVKSKVSGAFMEWIKNPTTSWDLPYILLGEVKRVIEK